MSNIQQLTFSWSPLDDLLEQIYGEEEQKEYVKKGYFPVGCGTLYYRLCTEFGYEPGKLDHDYIDEWYSFRRYGCGGMML